MKKNVFYGLLIFVMYILKVRNRSLVACICHTLLLMWWTHLNWVINTYCTYNMKVTQQENMYKNKLVSTFWGNILFYIMLIWLYSWNDLNLILYWITFKSQNGNFWTYAVLELKQEYVCNSVECIVHILFYIGGTGY